VRFAYGYAQCITFDFPGGGSRAVAIVQLRPSAEELRYAICPVGLAAKLDVAAINVNNLAASFIAPRSLRNAAALCALHSLHT